MNLLLFLFACLVCFCPLCLGAPVRVCVQADGTVSVWQPNKSGDMRETALGNHVGAVSSFLYDALGGASGILFSGGADGTVRVWDPWVRDNKVRVLLPLFLPACWCSTPCLRAVRFQEACVQVMHRHTGSVMDVAMGGSFLASAGAECFPPLSMYPSLTRACCLGFGAAPGNDGLIIVWRPAKARELLVYPWYELAQVLDFGSTYVRVLAASCACTPSPSLLLLPLHQVALCTRHGGL